MVEEFRRFVILWAYHPGASHVPSQAVDEAWHLAILFTQRYATMCQRFFGRFKHHNPSSSDRERVTLRGGYGHTLAQYEEVFGEDPPTDIWPAPRQALVAQDCGILDCGRDCDSKDCHQGCHAPCHFGCEGDECG